MERLTLAPPIPAPTSPANRRPGASGVMNHVSCGCCSSGCICNNHADIPNGRLVKVCEYHAALPYAPLDRSFRYDAKTRTYIRVPRPLGAA